ncbi:conserved hypothetical protein [Nocardia seriolae]|nr:conserved hypothetical protein [Nocardia seriolae]
MGGRVYVVTARLRTLLESEPAETDLGDPSVPTALGEAA